jgi:hypothetical protein
LLHLLTLGYTKAVCRNHLGVGSARHTDYLTTHNTHKRQTSMSPAGFESTIPASERPQTHTLDRAATGMGLMFSLSYLLILTSSFYSL